MKKLFHSRDAASKGAALIIVLAFVVLVTALALAHFSRSTTDRQLAQSSYNDTSADLLARSALDIMITDPTPIPNLIRRSFSGDPTGRTSSVSSGLAAANGRIISLARWNSHYLIPRASTTINIDSTPVSSFIAPDWVMVTGQGPTPAPAPNAVIGRYAFAVYDEGGLIDMNVAGSPIWHADDPAHGWKNMAGCPTPNPTPWLVNIGRKGTVAFADLTALVDPAAPAFSL